MDKSIILIRTSTKDQNPKLQLKECNDYNVKNSWDCIRIFEKQESAYKNEAGVWEDEIKWAINNDVKHLVVWNMDRFSRLEEERVLDQVKLLSVMHNIKIHAVNGDAWSEVAETIGKINEMGFIGKALAEFLETMLKGLEHQRAHRESETKSERVKLAVVKKDGKITKSYKGNKWGRPGVHTNKKNIVIKLRNDGFSYRDIKKKTGLSLGTLSDILKRS